jgi:hypothetical protein
MKGLGFELPSIPGLPSLPGMPSLSMPDISMPDISMPDVSMPSMSAPSLSAPDVRTPHSAVCTTEILPDIVSGCLRTLDSSLCCYSSGR